MSKGAAEAALTDAGFVPRSVYEYDAKAPQGQVMGQLPAAGTEAYPGAEVGLLVSKGLPAKVKVPDVTGLTEEAATGDLADVGLRAVPTEAYDEQVAKGSVAGQDPAAGTSVTPLSEVLVVVSLGQGTPAVSVPDVTGLTQAAASDRAEGRRPRRHGRRGLQRGRESRLGHGPGAGGRCQGGRGRDRGNPRLPGLGAVAERQPQPDACAQRDVHALADSLGDGNAGRVALAVAGAYAVTAAHRHQPAA